MRITSLGRESPGTDRGTSRHARAATESTRRPPLIAHILYRLDIGGLENGLVNLINAIPGDRFRHAIISLTEYTDFRLRIRRRDVQYYALHKRPGKDLSSYLQLWRLLRRLRPDIVHTRNLAALDCVVPAALAGVPSRVHGEHGRDMVDLDGSNWKYNLLRRALRPLIHRYIPLSLELEQWLHDRVGVPVAKTTRIYNGVDSELFHPATAGRERLPLPEKNPSDTVVIGTIGRMQQVKDQLTLARAFLALLDRIPEGRKRLRLVMVGDGPLRSEVAALLAAECASGIVWLPGARNDVPKLLRCFDIFVLPSLAEGISNTILEAMASGLPVVATRVGGNAELVEEGRTGTLVPPADPAAMARSLESYVRDPGLARRHGEAGRQRAESVFGIPRMVESYMAVYDQLLSGRVNR